MLRDLVRLAPAGAVQFCIPTTAAGPALETPYVEARASHTGLRRERNTTFHRGWHYALSGLSPRTAPYQLLYLSSGSWTGNRFFRRSRMLALISLSNLLCTPSEGDSPFHTITTWIYWACPANRVFCWLDRAILTAVLAFGFPKLWLDVDDCAWGEAPLPSWPDFQQTLLRLFYYCYF